MDTDNIIEDYTRVPEHNSGKAGSSEWKKSVGDSETFYAGQILKETRKEAGMTQSELAAKLDVTKSYISRVENGFINPSITVFYRIIAALGMRVEIVKPIG